MKGFPDVALNFAEHRGVCCQCGTDLWRLRQGISPLAPETIWRPSRQVPGGSLVCKVCWDGMSPGKRDPENNAMAFWRGMPTDGYFIRFHEPHPEVAATAAANAQLDPVDWFFNLSLTFLAKAALLAAQGLLHDEPPHACRQDFENNVRKGLRVRDFWEESLLLQGRTHPRFRGLVPAVPDFDQNLMLAFMVGTDLGSAIQLAEDLAPAVIGHHALYLVRAEAFTDPGLAACLLECFPPNEETSQGLHSFLARPEVARHRIGERMVKGRLAVVEGGRLKPRGLLEWPPLPESQVRTLLAKLSQS